MKSKWIIPFRGFNESGAFNLNLLWKRGNIYIMDNHRAALWCWFQHLDKKRKYNLLHIDKHNDTLCSQLEEWVKFTPDLWEIDINSYLNFSYGDSIRADKIRLFSWQNYLSIFLEKYAHLLDSCIFLTHKKGDAPNNEKCGFYEITKAPGLLYYLHDNETAPWICNIDLDFFFFQDPEELYVRLFSESFISQVFSNVKRQLERGTIAAFTIAMSPECCGGWKESTTLLNYICEIMEINFKLAPEGSS